MSDPYDILAGDYARHNETAPYNALYERPALLAMLGDQRGHDVLDLGCGPGPVAAALADGGARVTGVERSAAMLAAATARLGDRATLVHHDLTDPLPCGDGAFDTVAAGLVLHYLGDWSGVLAEVHRVLRPGGRFVASVHHPMTDRRIPAVDPAGHGDYLDSYPVTDRWTVGASVADVRFWHHPLGRMTGWITGAGLQLTAIVEPWPLPEMARTHPDSYAQLCAEPAFLLIGASRPAR